MLTGRRVGVDHLLIVRVCLMTRLCCTGVCCVCRGKGVDMASNFVSIAIGVASKAATTAFYNAKDVFHTLQVGRFAS